MRALARARTHKQSSREGRGGRRSGMKQRIRGLVSLHEIPFPPASYKGKKAIVHIVQRKRRRGGGREDGGRGIEREGGREGQEEK